MNAIKKALLVMSLSVASTATGASCNTFERIHKTLSDRGCQYLGPTTNKDGTVYTWVCSHPRGDEYRDFKKKDGKYCFVGSEVI